MTVALVTPPAVEPVSLYELKLQCGLSPVEDLDHIKSRMVSDQLRRYIATARAECENRTRRAFITQGWNYTLDHWPHHESRHMESLHDGPADHRVIRLPKPPFQAVMAVTYVDVTGTTQAIPPQTDYGVAAVAGGFAYQLDPGSETQPARIWPGFCSYWPPTRSVLNAISIHFTAGYGDTGAAVPASITQAILFLAHSYYDTTAYKDVDALVDNLLSPYMNRIS